MGTVAPTSLLTDMFGGGSSSSGTKGGVFLLHQYRAVATTSAEPFHFLLLIFVEALHHMGWCDYNPFMGFAVPMSAGAGPTKAGCMPHWCRDYTTFITCWASFQQKLSLAGGHPVMATAMQALATIVTSMVGANVNDATQWLVAAHVVMARLHDLCTTLDPTKLSAPLSLVEERNAMNRAKQVPQAKGQPSSIAGAASGRDNGSSTTDRRRPRAPPPRNEWQRNQRARPVIGARVVGTECPYHPGQGHSLFECNHYQRLSRQHQPNQGQQGKPQGP